MTFIQNMIRFLKGRNKKENRPPWIKVSPEGKFYTDKKCPKYNKFMRDQIDYHTQWELKEGKMIFTNDKGLNKPNIKDYY